VLHCVRGDIRELAMAVALHARVKSLGIEVIGSELTAQQIWHSKSGTASNFGHADSADCRSRTAHHAQYGGSQNLFASMNSLNSACNRTPSLSILSYVASRCRIFNRVFSQRSPATSEAASPCRRSRAMPDISDQMRMPTLVSRAAPPPARN
jgi:hypothetical protein